MAYVQLDYYMKNDDSASISYQVFNNQEKDEYPTFTICFTDYSGESFEDDFGHTFLRMTLSGLDFIQLKDGILELMLEVYDYS